MNHEPDSAILIAKSSATARKKRGCVGTPLGHGKHPKHATVNHLIKNASKKNPNKLVQAHLRSIAPVAQGSYKIFCHTVEKRNSLPRRFAQPLKEHPRTRCLRGPKSGTLPRLAQALPKPTQAWDRISDTCPNLQVQRFLDFAITSLSLCFDFAITSLKRCYHFGNNLSSLCYSFAITLP